MGVNDELPDLSDCPECGEAELVVTGRGPAGITPAGECRACGHKVPEDDAYWSDMQAQIDNPST